MSHPIEWLVILLFSCIGFIWVDRVLEGEAKSLSTSIEYAEPANEQRICRYTSSNPLIVDL